MAQEGRWRVWITGVTPAHAVDYNSMFPSCVGETSARYTAILDDGFGFFTPP